MKTMTKKHIYWIEFAVILGMLIALFVCFSGLASESEAISDQVLRLHILANSDSDEDQALKLKVRDAILEEYDFGMVDDLAEAEQYAYDHLDDITQTAQQVVYQEGYDYPVHAELVNMFFDTREYDDFTMPAGRYDALRITIGDAQGHNWWCVLYPPLCVPAAELEQELEETLTEDQCDLIEDSPKYDIRFAVIDLWENMKNTLSGQDNE